MLRYVIKRLLQMIPTVIGVMILTFVLFYIVPNDLAVISLGKNASLKGLDDFDQKRGLNKPLLFGVRATSRAYEDHDFSDGAGRWNTWSNAVYYAESKTVMIEPNTQLNALGFALDGTAEYEWKIRFRGNGTVAGKKLDSTRWRTEKVRFTGQNDASFEIGDRGLEIKNLRLREIQNSPFDSQLFFYTKSILKGDLGTSETFHQPVSKLLRDGIPKSLALMIPIFVIGLITAISISLICAFFRNTWIDRSLVVLSVALMSINYLVYIVFGQYYLAYKQGLFPVWGCESWRYFVLPVIIGVVSGLGSNIRFYRTIMLDEVYKDYVRTAFSKGVPKSRVLFVHVLKNAMIPIITNVVIAIPFLYTGSLLLESFFGIPGLGYLGISSITQSDVDVVRSLVLIGALLFVICNLLTDICYALADPRVKLK
ncbi:MAG: ABC transporter permease [Pontiellaceae bacterium]|nr:ABC transporter permease [Pontiellaceae bacterium]